MNKQKAKTSNLAIILIAAAFIGIAALVFAGKRETGKLPIPSTYSSHPVGIKALFMALGKSGFDVRRLKRGCAHIPADAGVIVITQPSYPVTSLEAGYLREWMDKGGSLVIAAPCYDGLYEKLELGSGCGFRGDTGAADVRGRGGLLNGVMRLGPFITGGLRKLTPGTVPLLYTEGAAFLGSARRGRGRIFFSTSGELFSNSALAQRGNVRFAFNLFKFLGVKKAVYFDEFHHGFTEAGDTPVFTFRDAVFSTPYGLFAVTILAALIILLLNRDGLKVERPRAAGAAPTPMEFTYALADLQRRANAHTESAANMIDIFRKELVRLNGIPADTPLRNAIEIYTNDDSRKNKLARLATARQQIAAGGKIAPKEALELAGIIEKYRREMRAHANE